MAVHCADVTVTVIAFDFTVGVPTLQQLREAIPSDHAYRFLLRDRDSIFSNDVDDQLQAFRLRVCARRPLITSPLEWQITAAPVPHPVIPVLAERGGTQLQTPRPTLLVDTHERNPFSFSRFTGWFAGGERKALAVGDLLRRGHEGRLCSRAKGPR